MMIRIDINSDGIYKIEKGVRIVKEFELSAIAIVLGVAETDLLKEFRNNL
mgnify:CR=1 FL=1